MESKVEIVNDENGKLAVIHDIRFKGKRNINWKEVEQYLKEYVGQFYEIEENAEKIYIGNDLPDEFTGSEYTHSMKGAHIRIKANAAQGIPEMIYKTRCRW